MRVPENFLVEGKIYDLTVTAIKETCIIVLIDGTQYTATVHISNLSKKYVSNIAEFTDIGMHLRAKAVKWKNHIELSIKDAGFEPKPKQTYAQSEPDTQPPQDSQPKPQKKKSQTSDFDKMLANCEASFRDKMRSRMQANQGRGRYTRTGCRHKKNNGSE